MRMRSFLPIKFKRSPLCPMAVTGGMSCTWNTSFASPLLPGVKAMYEPESSVPKPVTPLWSIRGLTTQNWVSLRMRPDTSALSWAVTSTPFWSSRSLIRVTRPTSMLNTLMTVLLTSMPSALSIKSVTTGPLLRISLTQSQPPAISAISGTSQTAERKVLFLRTRA